MSNDKQPKEEVNQKSEEKTEVKEKPKKTQGKLHIAKLFYKFCDEGRVFPNGVEDCVQALWDIFQKVGQTTNIRGNLITKENLKSQVKAIMFDIKAERTGVWAKYKFTDDKNGLALKTA